MDNDDDNDDEDEVNPFLSISCDVFSDDVPQRKCPPRTARNWGIPTFSDQIDRDIRSYCLCDCVTVHLDYRLHSTGSDLWDSSLVMAHALPNWIPDMNGMHVLELGSGTGAVGLYCSKAFGANVILTDLVDNLALLDRNRAENELQHRVIIAPLNWTTPELPDNVIREGQGVDFILGSDLCKYMTIERIVHSVDCSSVCSFLIDSTLSRMAVLPFAPHLLLSLAQTLKSIMSIRVDKPDLTPTKAFLVYEERFDCSAFFTSADSQDLEVTHIDNSLLHPKYQDPDRIHVLQISLRQS